MAQTCAGISLSMSVQRWGLNPGLMHVRQVSTTVMSLAPKVLFCFVFVYVAQDWSQVILPPQPPEELGL